LYLLIRVFSPCVHPLILTINMTSKGFKFEPERRPYPQGDRKTGSSKWMVLSFLSLLI